MEPRYTRFLISANAKSPPPLKRRNRRLGAARAACFARHRCETPPPRPGFPLPPELVGLIAEQLPVAGIAALAGAQLAFVACSGYWAAITAIGAAEYRTLWQVLSLCYVARG